jgi:hypothetical protein
MGQVGHLGDPAALSVIGPNASSATTMPAIESIAVTAIAIP